MDIGYGDFLHVTTPIELACCLTCLFKANSYFPLAPGWKLLTIRMRTRLYSYHIWDCVHGHIAHMYNTKHDGSPGPQQKQDDELLGLSYLDINMKRLTK